MDKKERIKIILKNPFLYIYLLFIFLTIISVIIIQHLILTICIALLGILLFTIQYSTKQKLRKYDKISVALGILILSLLLFAFIIANIYLQENMKKGNAGYFYFDNPLDMNGDGEFYVPTQTMEDLGGFSTYYILIKNPTGNPSTTFSPTINITIKSIAVETSVIHNFSQEILDFKIYCMWVGSGISGQRQPTDSIPVSTITSFTERENWGIIHKNNSLNGVQAEHVGTQDYGGLNNLSRINATFRFENLQVTTGNFAIHFIIWIKLNMSAFGSPSANWKPLDEIDIEFEDDISSQSGIHPANIYYGLSNVGISSLQLSTFGWMLFFAFLFIITWIIVVLFAFLIQKGKLVSRISILFVLIAVILFIYFLAVELDIWMPYWESNTAWMSTPGNPLAGLRGLILLIVEIVVIVEVVLSFVFTIGISLFIIIMGTVFFVGFLTVAEENI